MTTDHQMVALPRASLLALNAALLRDAGVASASYLQEAGYAASEALFAALAEWAAARGDAAPTDAPIDVFHAQMRDFFAECGWGTLEAAPLGEELLTLDAAEWAESEVALALEHPSCHLSTGLFAGLFEQVGGEPLAVLEVECRSAGSDRCRWLVGSPTVLGSVYDRLARGESYAPEGATV
jgi:predicted hydrocarbon binding protein